VEGLNFVKRHMRKTQDNPQGGIIEKEAPLALGKLRLYDEAGDKKKKAPAAKA
jgi:large subunit ribosomal protein L24